MKYFRICYCSPEPKRFYSFVGTALLSTYNTVDIAISVGRPTYFPLEPFFCYEQ